MFPELHQSLSDAIATGKVGTPVSIRVHLQLPDRDADFETALDSIVAMVKPAVQQPLKTLQSRLHCDGNQWNLLMRSANGRSVFVTLGRGSVPERALELLVVGNHGVIRLEGGEVLYEAVGYDHVAPDVQRPAEGWTEFVRRSHDEGSIVTFTQ